MVIKLILSRFLKSGIGNVLSTIFTTWRAYILLGVIFSVYILSLKAKIKLTKIENDKVNKEIVKIQIKLDILNNELSVCQLVNKEVNSEVSKATALANKCTDLWQKSKNINIQTNKKLKLQETIYAKKIKKIKGIKPITDCDNEPNTLNFDKWLRSEKTDS